MAGFGPPPPPTPTPHIHHPQHHPQHHQPQTPQHQQQSQPPHHPISHASIDGSPGSSLLPTYGSGRNPTPTPSSYIGTTTAIPVSSGPVTSVGLAGLHETANLMDISTL